MKMERGRAGRENREARIASRADPLTAIPVHFRHPARNPSSPFSTNHSSRTPSFNSSSAHLAREASERARAQALVARRKAECARLDGSATPSTVHAVEGDMYTPTEAEGARRERT